MKQRNKPGQSPLSGIVRRSIIIVIFEVLPPRLTPRTHRLRPHATKRRNEVKFQPSPTVVRSRRQYDATAMALMLAARSEEQGGAKAHTAAVEEHASEDEERREQREAETEAEFAGCGAV